MATRGSEKHLEHPASEKEHEEIITTHLNADFDALAA